MKRIFLLCMTLSIAILGSQAQENSGFWSVKAGVNFANFTNSNYTSDCQTGFNVGALRAFSLSKQIPIYIQSGVSFEMKGAQNSYSVEGFGYSTTIKSYALEIPVLVNYGIKITDNSTIHPFVGVYYSVALGGSMEEDGETINPYKKESAEFGYPPEIDDTQVFSRSDFGIRFGLDYKYKKYSIGVAYDAGVMNIFAKDFRDANFDASTGSFSINLGYYFK